MGCSQYLYCGIKANGNMYNIDIEVWKIIYEKCECNRMNYDICKINGMSQIQISRYPSIGDTANIDIDPKK